MQETNQQSGNRLKNVIPFIPEGDFYFSRGVKAFQKRKFARAIKWLQRAIEREPNNPLYPCQMSIVYTEIGAYHTANQILTNVKQSNGETYMDCYYLLANNYAHLGLLDDARKHAEFYLQKDPNGDFREEAEQLLLLLESFMDEDDAGGGETDEFLMMREAALYYMDYRQWSKALPLLRKMMARFPDHVLIRHYYALALFFFGQRQDAVQMEKEMLAQHPESMHSHANLAIFYYQQGNSEYKQHIQALLNIYPIHVEQKLFIAGSFIATGYYKEAYNRFSMLKKTDKVNYMSYYLWYSFALYHTGRREKALSIWKEGCKRHPHLSQKKGPWHHS
ncbi:MAG TPA: hypothetical protein VK136_06550 [Bacillota bacterium]|nr:hypothetical protein [Bacillota bacterium]